MRGQFRAIALRIIICLFIAFIPFDKLEQGSFDLRFSLRGEKKGDKRIVLITIDKEKFFSLKRRMYQEEILDDWLWEHVQSIPESSESLLWDSKLLYIFLKRLTAMEPAAIGWMLFFPKDIEDSTPKGHGLKIFQKYNDRTIWASRFDAEYNLLKPPSKLVSDENTGYINLFPSEDERVLRAYTQFHKYPSMALKICEKYFQKKSGNNPENLRKCSYNRKFYINYAGLSDAYSKISFESFFSKKNPPDPAMVADKIILIGLEGNLVTSFQTPFKRLSRLNIQANIVDSLVNRKGISRASKVVNVLFSIFASLLAIFLIIYYPFEIAAVFIFIEALLIFVFTIILFDNGQIWLNMANPLICILTCYFVFTNFLLVLKEHSQWKIEKESQFLKEVDQLKSNFLSLISHDLKTPIARIEAITSTLLHNDQDNISENQKKSLGKIMKSAEELRSFISRILNITRIDQSRIKVNKDVVDINSLIEGIVDEQALRAIENDIKIISELSPIFSIEVDEGLIRQAITNVLENAIKYSPPNSQIKIISKEREDHIEIIIEDEGHGIPKSELKKIFDKFYRVDSELSIEKKGSGLGLYLVKYFIELHHGKVIAENREGGGSRFTVILPLEA